MAAWQPISAAPKDGTVFLGLYGGVAALAAWSFRRSTQTIRTTTGWLWWKTSTVERTEWDVSGWYLVHPNPEGEDFRYSTFGNEVKLTGWQELPAPEAEA